MGVQHVRTRTVLLGIAAGGINGLLGTGGGAVLVPAMIRILNLQQREAMASSLAVTAPLSALSLVLYWVNAGISWSLAWPFLIGGVVGGLLAGHLFCRMPPVLLGRIFGALMVYGGVRSFF